MKYLSGIRATALIIICSLFPGSGDTAPVPPPAPPQPVTIPPEGIRAAIGSLCSADRSLALQFSHAYSIAAPFLLFRLKRLGYSNCRVIVTQGGLRVFADR